MTRPPSPSSRLRAVGDLPYEPASAPASADQGHRPRGIRAGDRAICECVLREARAGVAVEALTRMAPATAGAVWCAPKGAAYAAAATAIAPWGAGSASPLRAGR